MTEKHRTPETSFSVGEIYSRLDQVIYDHKEEEEKYGRRLSDEMANTYESALNVVIAIGRMNPLPDTQKKFKHALDKLRETHKVDDATYRIIEQQIY